MITAEEAQRIWPGQSHLRTAELLPAAERHEQKNYRYAPLAVKYTMEAIERVRRDASGRRLISWRRHYLALLAPREEHAGRHQSLHREKESKDFKGQIANWRWQKNSSPLDQRRTDRIRC